MKKDELLERYSELKAESEEAQSAYNRAQGALSTYMIALKGQFGCATIAEATKKLKKFGEAVKAHEAKFQEALDAFEKEWEEKNDADE